MNLTTIHLNNVLRFHNRFELDNLYKEMSNHLDLFDTSNYPREYFLFSEKNKKVVDKMKDETAGEYN